MSAPPAPASSMPASTGASSSSAITLSRSRSAPGSSPAPTGIVPWRPPRPSTVPSARWRRRCSPRASCGELDLSPDEERLVLAEPGCRSSPSSRLDSFFDDEVRYVEFNAESPAGMAYGDVLGEVMDDLPVMRRFRERWHLTPLRSRVSQLDCMLAAFADWGRGSSPSIAIVDWPGLPTLNEFDMFSRVLRRSRHPVPHLRTRLARV